jgi:hypothetical protein
LDLAIRLSSDPLVTSAERIRHRVWQDAISADFSWDITERFAAALELHRNYYSDSNSSLEAEFSPQYAIPLPGSQFIVGYDFGYAAFARNPNDGYWAPQRSIANEGSVAWGFTRGNYFGRLRLASGPDAVREAVAKGDRTNGPAGGWGTSAVAAMGWRPTENLTVQSYWTTDRSAQWNSTTTGLLLNYLF